MVQWEVKVKELEKYPVKKILITSSNNSRVIYRVHKIAVINWIIIIFRALKIKKMRIIIVDISKKNLVKVSKPLLLVVIIVPLILQIIYMMMLNYKILWIT